MMSAGLEPKARTGVAKFYQSTPDHVLMVFIYLCLSLALLAVLLPLLFILASSFSSAESIAAGKVLLWPVDFNVRGYAMLFRTSAIMYGYRNSIFYTVVGTAINLVLTTLMAYPLSRKDFQARGPLSIVLLITMFFSGGMIPSYLVVKSLGIINTVWAMLLPGSIAAWNVILTRTYIQSNIPASLHESASLDGCGDFQYFIHILIPLAKPIIAVMALLYGIGHWNSYFGGLLYLSKRELFPLQLVLRDILILNMGVGNPADVKRQQELLYFTYLLRYSTIIAACVPIMLAYPIVQKYFVRGIMVGAIKG